MVWQIIGLKSHQLPPRNGFLKVIPGNESYLLEECSSLLFFSTIQMGRKSVPSLFHPTVQMGRKSVRPTVSCHHTDGEKECIPTLSPHHTHGEKSVLHSFSPLVWWKFENVSHILFFPIVIRWGKKSVPPALFSPSWRGKTFKEWEILRNPHRHTHTHPHTKLEPDTLLHFLPIYSIHFISRS